MWSEELLLWCSGTFDVELRSMFQESCATFLFLSTSLVSGDQMKNSVKEPNMFHNYETEKITHKASDTAENLQLYRVVRFFHPRSSCRTHLNVIVWTSADICVMYDDLGWKNQTTCYNCRFSAALRVIFSGGTTDKHVIIAGFGSWLQLIRIRRILGVLTE